MEDIYPQELIKEYLVHNGFSSTLECFTAESKSKILSKNIKRPKSTDVMPRLYTIALGEDGKATRVSNLEKRLENSEKSKENVLRTGRKLFEIAVDALQMLDTENTSSYSDKVLVYKQQLAKIQDVLGLRVYESQTSLILNNNFIQDIKAKILNESEKKNYQSLAEALVTLRAESLSAPKEKRGEIIRNLSSEDIFSGSLRSLLALRNHSVKTSLLSIVSILCSQEHGRKYVLSGYSATIIAHLMAEIKEQESGSVAQRFALSCLSKLSYTEDEVCAQLVDSNFIEYLIKTMLYNQVVRKSPTHPFVHTFGSALLANILNFGAGRQYVVNYPESNVLLRYLLDCIKESSLVGEAICALLICISVVLETCDTTEHGNVEREIRDFVALYAERTDETEEMKNLVLSACTSLIQKREIETRLTREDENLSTSEIFDFECFTDEIQIEL